MRRTSTSYPLVAALLAAFAAPSSLAAQLTVPSGRVSQGARWMIGADLSLVEPKGDFAKYVDRGFGGGATGFFRLDPSGVFFARGEFSGVRYGRQAEQVFVFGNRAELATTNNIQWFGLGLQAGFPRGPVRPYVNATLATTHFVTSSTLKDYYDQEYEYGRIDHMSDWAQAWIFGGGLYISFGRNSPFAANVGARYSFGSQAKYLPEGGVKDNPDGTVTLTPVTSKTDLIVWQLGVSIALTPQLLAGN